MFLNDTPKSVITAVYIMYGTLAMFLVAYLIEKWNGMIGDGEFMGGLLFTLLISIFPYKIAKKSNAARYLFAGLTVVFVVYVMGVGFWDEGVGVPMNMASIAEIPMDILVSFLLFREESRRWFSKEEIQTVAQ